MPLLLLPLLARPVLGIAAAVIVIAMMLASVSPAYPVALGGVPAVAIAVYGGNPLPRGAISLALFAWVALAIIFLVTRDETAMPSGVWFSPMIVLSVGLAGLMLARLGASPDPGYGTAKLELYVGQNVALLVAGIAIARRRGDFDTFVVLTLVVAGLTGLILTFALAGGTAQTGVGGRYGLSPEENPIQLGREAALGVVTAAYILLASRVAWQRVAALATLPVAAVALTASGSRGPVLGLVLSLLVLISLAARDRTSRKRLLIVGAGAFAAAVLVVQLVPGQNAGRTFAFIQGGGSGLSSNGRAHLWSQAWDVFANHPFFGLGTGGFSSLGLGELYPHNLLLEVAAELGLIGLALMLAILGIGINRIARAWRYALGLDRLRVAFVGSLFGITLTNALVSGDIQSNSTLWLTLGLALGIAPDAAPSTAPSG